MAKDRITISLEPELLERIRAAAEASGDSVSSEIARCCRHSLGPADGVVSFEALGRAAADLRRLADVLTGSANR